MPISPDLACTAMLADPQSGALPAAAAPAAGDVIARLLQRNKVSLLPAAHSGTTDLHALLALPALAAYLADEQQTYAQLRREYATIRAAFAAGGFPDVLIKSAGIAPSFPHLSDNVDDLVPADRIPEARLPCAFSVMSSCATWRSRASSSSSALRAGSRWPPTTCTSTSAGRCRSWTSRCSSSAPAPPPTTPSC